VDGQDGVAGVVLVKEQGPQLGLLEVLLELIDPRSELGLDALAFGRELGEDFELLLLAEDLAEELDVLLKQLLLLLEGLGGFLVLPDLGRGQADAYRLELGGLAIEVKENPGPLRPFRRGLGVGCGDRSAYRSGPYLSFPSEPGGAAASGGQYWTTQ
jgi:hypothetical protein